MEQTLGHLGKFSYEDHIGLWKEELATFFPDSFIDIHSHIGTDAVMGPLERDRPQSPLADLPSQEWEELLRIYGEIYPGKHLDYAVAFPFVLREVHVKEANSYVLRKAREDSRVLPVLLASARQPHLLEESWQEAQAMGQRVYGVKPYLELADRPDSWNVMNVSLPEFVREEFLDFCEAHDLPLMLHTSGGGVGDPAIRTQLEAILDNHPRLRLILAHMGRFYNREDFFAFLDTGFMTRYADRGIWFDLSIAADTDVFARMIAEKDLRKRLLFGGDFPFGLIPGADVHVEGVGGLFLTRELYAWSDVPLQERFAAERKRITYNTYHTLKTLKDAVEREIPDPAERAAFLADLFQNNARTLLGI